MFDAISVANDVSQAIFETVRRHLGEKEEFHMDLMPAELFGRSRPAWGECLEQIFTALRQRYALLPRRPTEAEVIATWRAPLLITRQVLVGKIVSPSPRLGRGLHSRDRD